MMSLAALGSLALELVVAPLQQSPGACSLEPRLVGALAYAHPSRWRVVLRASVSTWDGFGTDTPVLQQLIRPMKRDAPHAGPRRSQCYPLAFRAGDPVGMLKVGNGPGAARMPGALSRDGWETEIAWLGKALSDYKTLVERSFAFHNDALHILAGVTLHFVVAGLLRKSLGHWLPLTIVLALELANEANDFLVERWPDVPTQLGEGVKDLLLTLVIPMMLFVTVRWMPALYQKERPPASLPEASGDPGLMD